MSVVHDIQHGASDKGEPASYIKLVSRRAQEEAERNASDVIIIHSFSMSDGLLRSPLIVSPYIIH